MPFSITQEQIFEIMRTAAARKADLELELMRRELGARIPAAVTAAAAAAAVATQAPKRTGIEKDDIIGEISSEVKNTSLCSAGFSPR